MTFSTDQLPILFYWISLDNYCLESITRHRTILGRLTQVGSVIFCRFLFLFLPNTRSRSSPSRSPSSVYQSWILASMAVRKQLRNAISDWLKHIKYVQATERVSKIKLDYYIVCWHCLEKPAWWMNRCLTTIRSANS